MRSPKQPPKLAMLFLLAFLLQLCNGVGNVHCSRIHENSADLHALLDFHRGITEDPKGALSNWNTTTHFCHWNGVTCTTTRPFRVSTLNLTSHNLQGHITPSLGNLTFLNRLDLSHNSFVGTFPVLNNLQLQSILMRHNSLTGINPNALSNCSNLGYLDFSSNLLVGAIPTELGILSNLYYIDLRSNQLAGSIPDELGKLQSLQYLYLGNNSLSGEFPRAILNLSSLQYLSLEMNMLGRALPPNIGDLLPNLIQITLGNNTFEGPIPASLGNAAGLQMIDLPRNNFTGKIPTSFGKLANLTILNLEVNQLEATDSGDWEFLNALTNCRSLNSLSLSYNQLQGSIPQSIGNLSPSLEHLLLLENRISSQVPESIGALSGLTKLALGGNNLSGTIEGWVGNLKGLKELNLRSNSFTGIIPSSIGNLTNLTKLYIQKNEFEGPIPASLGNLPLLELDLSSNNLQGYIPPNFGNQDFIYLNLSHNNLQGDIPHISNLIKQLIFLDLSSNKLTGPIPDSLGQCYGLEGLQMDQNFLTGNIPSNFGNLTLLSMLNLSHNNLSGNIPFSLNRLKLLNSLDLSYNRLQGEIPTNGVFENATAVSLEGNSGLCGGSMHLHMVACTFSASKKAERRNRLIKVLIPIFGFMSVLLLVYFLLIEKKMRKRTEDTSASLGDNFLRVSYADLAQGTANFSESNLVGRGGYGSVYRGKLKESKVEVAVKVFDLEMHGAEKSFLKECQALRSIQHRNLLPIITACSTVDNTGNVFKALVYEFMPNGNLDTWLHHRKDGKTHQPSLAQRLSIAVNMADALDYLHFDCGRPTIHCDLKPSNILLDNDMTALLGDFGIASLYKDSWPTSTDPMSSSSTGVKGTIGYIAPEYAGGARRASTSGDVYGFGIILLEMMIGKRPTDPMFKDGITIVDFVESNFPHEIAQIVDPNISEECKDIAKGNKVSECLVSVLQLALSCTHRAPSERMNMKEIANKMHAIKTSYVGQKAECVRH